MCHHFRRAPPPLHHHRTLTLPLPRILRSTQHSTALAEAPDRRQICFAGAGLKCPATCTQYPTLARPLRLSQHRMRRRLTHRPSLPLHSQPHTHTQPAQRGGKQTTGYHRHSIHSFSKGTGSTMASGTDQIELFVHKPTVSASPC